MFSVFENIKINDYEQFANNMNYNFSGPMENDTHYKQPQHFFNNSMILNLAPNTRHDIRNVIFLLNNYLLT